MSWRPSPPMSATSSTESTTSRPLASRRCRPAEWHVSSSPSRRRCSWSGCSASRGERGFDPFFPDTASYLRVSDRGPFWPRFWFDERPPAYPLVLWLLGGGGRAVVLVQSVAYVVAWIWLGAVVWQRIASRPVAAVTIGVLALTAVQARWALWTTQILTESLSITLARRRRRRLVAVRGRAAAVADRRRHRRSPATWMLLRDSNAITFTVFAVPALVLALVLMRTERDRPPAVFGDRAGGVGRGRWLLVDRPDRVRSGRDVVPQQRRAALAAGSRRCRRSSSRAGCRSTRRCWRGSAPTRGPTTRRSSAIRRWPTTAPGPTDAVGSRRSNRS